MHVATLTASDASRYRELMLEAYVQAEDAFTSTLEERIDEPLSYWVNRIGSASGVNQAFGSFEGQQLIGTVALEFSVKPKTRHSALVIGMYVKPSRRGLGAGTLLMNSAISAARARPEVSVLRLRVTQGNEAAIRLYQSVGFSTWGIEPLAVTSASGFKAKVHMARQLGGTETAA